MDQLHDGQATAGNQHISRALNEPGSDSAQGAAESKRQLFDTHMHCLTSEAETPSSQCFRPGAKREMEAREL